MICEKFAAEGANLMINYASAKNKAEELAGKCTKDFGVKAAIVQGVGLVVYLTCIEQSSHGS